METFKKSDGEFKVDFIPYSEVREWLLYKHYAHRIPPVNYSFGLYRDGFLEGVLTFGRPYAPSLIKESFGGEYQDEFLELNRVVVNDGLPKNVLSFFVTQCLKMLPKPMVVVSYADSKQGHHGYIYQATNWLYTGLSAPFMDYMVKGCEGMHQASVLDRVGRSDKDGHLDKVKLLKEVYGEENVYMVERSRKHRYYYLHGDKRQVKRMRKLLKYPVVPYPKGRNKRYDASYETHPNGLLFEM